MKLPCAILYAGVITVIAGCSDVIQSNHATIALAKSHIDRGWIPPFLPASTVQIRESHNLDTNVGHGTFSFGADTEKFRAELTAWPAGEAINDRRIPRDKMEKEGYSFYRRDGFLLAVDWNRRRGEFWLR